MKNCSMVLLIACFGCVEPTAVVIEPLRVINWSPSSGAFCVDVNATISATFSDALDEGTLTGEHFQLRNAGGVVDATLDHDTTGYIAQLAPAAPLAFDTLYTVVAARGLRGQDQGGLSVDLEASFQTIARYGCTPGVECVLPSDCPDNQICANIGVCIDECVTDKDCFRGTCNQASSSCEPENPSDGGDGGDSGGGD